MDYCFVVGAFRLAAVYYVVCGYRRKDICHVVRLRVWGESVFMDYMEYCMDVRRSYRCVFLHLSGSTAHGGL